MAGTENTDPLRAPFPSAGSRGSERKPAASLGELVARIPRLLIELAKSEIEHAKREMIGKGRSYGVAAGLFAGAALFVVTMYVVLVAALVMWFATFLPGWAAALIVAGISLLIAAILGLLGVRSVKSAGGPKPQRTMENLQQDMNAVKGLGRYE